MKELNIEGAYLVMQGMVATPYIIKKLIKEGSVFYACPVEDRG